MWVHASKRQISNCDVTVRFHDDTQRKVTNFITKQVRTIGVMGFGVHQRGQLVSQRCVASNCGTGYTECHKMGGGGTRTGVRHIP
jgi:hypothetical protein